MTKLDDLDMRILSALHSDASEGVPELCRRLEVGRSLLYSRIRRLRRLRVLERYTVQVNEDALGVRAGAVAGLNIDLKNRESALAGIKRVEEVRLVREVTGRFDALVDLRGGSLDELHRVIYERIGSLPGVTHVEIFVEMSRTTPPLSFKLGTVGTQARSTRPEKLQIIPRI
ncbi:MAG TPA: Lrp/AsnC family transcriptional regulator [Nitrososphaerales archaeon]|nr:Lrp/AsnC family transcriptional regulator [Nitrososphaerales archaeon]